MKKYIIISAIALMALIVVSMAKLVSVCCVRIESGQEGILVNLYGSEEGGNDVSPVIGFVWYNPFTQVVYEYPTFVQKVDYPAFSAYAKDGLEFTVYPTVSVKMIDGQATHIFRKYRSELSDIIDISVFDYTKEAFRSQINNLTTDEIIANRGILEMTVRKQLATTLNKEGFQLEQLVSGLVYPSHHSKCCQCECSTDINP